MGIVQRQPLWVSFSASHYGYRSAPAILGIVQRQPFWVSFTTASSAGHFVCSIEAPILSLFNGALADRLVQCVCTHNGGMRLGVSYLSLLLKCLQHPRSADTLYTHIYLSTYSHSGGFMFSHVSSTAGIFQSLSSNAL
jgi:hypothetical protein